MFGDLKAIIDVIKTGVEGVSIIKDSREREKAVLDLLQIYFILMDVVNDGMVLLKSFKEFSNSNQCYLTKEHAREKIEEWNYIVNKQTIRLNVLGEKLLAQDALSIIDPNLQKQIKDIVGDKFENANCLQNIVAVLFFKMMFGKSREEEELVDILNLIYQADGQNIIDISANSKQLEKLKAALESYRLVCLRLITESEILILSKKARKETLFFKKDNSRTKKAKKLENE